MGPQIPYIKIPEIPLPFPNPFNSIKPFGLLVATGVYLGAVIAVRRARQRGLDVEKLNTFILYVVGVGFIGAHVLDAVFYTPDRLSRDPLYIFKLWAGLSSYGGFFGAILGLFLYKWRFKESVLGYADVVCSAFPLAWVFGRTGCSVVHDHPGRLTESFLGVQYMHPDIKNSDVIGLLYDPLQTLGRFDLGLIEMVLTVPLAVAFHFLWKARPRNFGFYPGWMCIAYAPVRFVLDFFRIAPGDPMHLGEADPRHFGLTPAQYACFILLGIGIFLVKFSKQYPAPASWAEVEPWRGDEEPAAVPVKRKAADADSDERRSERRKRDRAKSKKVAGKPADASAKKSTREAAAKNADPAADDGEEAGDESPTSDPPAKTKAKPIKSEKPGVKPAKSKPLADAVDDAAGTDDAADNEVASDDDAPKSKT